MGRTRRPELTAHRLQLSDDDVVLARGLPMMTPARTWLDLASVLSLPDLVAAGDSALRSGCTRAELDAVVRRNAGKRGARRAREALALLDPRSRSRPESHLRVAVSAPDLPPFDVNEPIHRDEGGWLAEPDLSLAEAKLALEYQGVDHADPKRMRADLTRQTDLRQAGWLCLPYGPAEVFRRPYAVAAEVRADVRLRAPHVLPPVRRGTRRNSRVVR
jgi:hypothetical protein